MLPALSLAAVPGRRVRTIDLAQEIESRGFPGIFGPSLSDVMSLCVSLSHVTSRVTFGSTIQPIYLRHPADLAQAATYIHETSGGRFRLGLGVSHAPAHARLGVTAGKPLSDITEYVAAVRAAVPDPASSLPPIWLAALRDRMLALATEIGAGAVWANAARSAMAGQLARVGVPDGFAVAAMIPTVVDEDRDAGRAAHRKTLVGYASLPNYRNYWRGAGYGTDMDLVEKALESGDRDGITAALSDDLIDDITLTGSPAEIAAGVADWNAAGVDTPILVPSSTRGGQLVAFEEVFAAFSSCQ